MIGPDAETIAAYILQQCDVIERQVRAMVAGAPSAIDFALSQIRVGWPIPAPLPGFVKDAIRKLVMEAVIEAADLIYEALDMFRMLAKAVGKPSALRAAAATLETGVIARAATLDESMVDSVLQGLTRDAWESAAADSYQSAFNEQSRAVGEVDEPARMLKHVLEDLADSIEQFFTDLQNAFIGFAITVAGLIVTVATGVTGVGAVVGVIITLGGLAWSIYSFVQVFQGSTSRSSDMATRLTGTPALEWPQSAFAQ